MEQKGGTQMKSLTILLVSALGVIAIPSAGYAQEDAPAAATERPRAKRVEEKKAKLRERLEYLKENNPEAYRKVMAHLRDRRREKLERLKTDRPEAYKRLMAERKERLENKLAELKEKNPERYQELVEKRRQWRGKRLDEFRQNHPEAYQRFMEKHPAWAQGPHDRGVRDHGRGQGRGGVGQGGEHRSPRSKGGIRGGGGGRR